MTIFCNDIFAQGDIDIFFAEKFKGSHFEFFVENISRGNPVQILLNFPAKSQIYLNKFSQLLKEEKVLRLVLLFIECMKIKITKEMSENCRVY